VGEKEISMSIFGADFDRAQRMYDSRLPPDPVDDEDEVFDPETGRWISPAQIEEKKDAD
jgi:hypothetical protein